MSLAGRTLSQPFVPDLDPAPRRWWWRPALWVRMAVMGFAAFALSSEVAGGWGTRAAILGALTGVLFGQRLGGGRLRLAPMVLGFGALTTFAWWLSGWFTSGSVVPAMLGPTGALSLGAVARMGVAAFSVTALLRAAAARKPDLGILELLVAAAGLVTIFAAHRDGVVARPLWLADWAGQAGFDPKFALMLVGAVGVFGLAVASLMESGRKVSLAALAPLGVFVALMLMFVDADDLPQPQASNDLGLTDPEIGEPPRPSDIPGQDQRGPGNAQGPNHQGQNQNQGQGQGQGQGDQAQHGGGGQGQGDPLQEALRGGGGQGGDQQQQGGQGQGQGQQQQGQGQGQGQEQQGQGQGGQQQQPPDLQRDQAGGGSGPAPMAIVLLGDDYVPPTQAYYFRQQVWSEHVGVRLIETRRGDVDRDLIRSFPSRTITAPEPPPEAFHKRVSGTVSLVVRHVNPFGLESAVQMQPATNPKPGRFWRAYAFESLVPDWEPEDLVGRTPGSTEWTPAQWEHYLDGPEDPRYAELAKQILESIPEDRRSDPFIAALAVKLWMDEQLTYSINERHAGVPDPTADFLFGNQVGYCVHFAHAAVYLWRSLGIPARVGAGYHVEADKARGSSILIRGGDAHAWPELYLEGVGWVILDISPQQSLDPPGSPMDDELAEKMAEWARDKPEAIDDPERDSSGQLPRSDFRDEIAAASMIFSALLFLTTFGIKLWRRLSPLFCDGRALPRVGYRRALDRLSEAGHRRRWGESREAFARRLSSRIPAFTEMTALHVASHLQNPARTSTAEGDALGRERKRWAELDHRLRREIAPNSRWWRRWLGAINPLSFLGAR